MPICSICGMPYEGHGNNAQPVNDGRCCNECDEEIVVPRRMQDAAIERRKIKNGNKNI